MSTCESFAEEEFLVGGAFSLPFLLTAEDTIADLTGATVTAKVRPYGGSTIDLNVGNGGIVIDDEHPSAAADPANQEPHGRVILTALQTAALALGSLTTLRIYAQMAGDTAPDHTPLVTLRGVE